MTGALPALTMLKVCEGKSFILKELRRWASQGGEKREGSHGGSLKEEK